MLAFAEFSLGARANPAINIPQPILAPAFFALRLCIHRTVLIMICPETLAQRVKGICEVISFVAAFLFYKETFAELL